MTIPRITSLPARLCRLQDIEERGCREFVLCLDEGHEQPIFLIRVGPQVYGYVNSCPHTRVALNWQAGLFLNLERDYIQCGTHGALFRIEDGYCVRGPCSGQSLRPVRLGITGEGLVMLGNAR